MRFKKKYYLLLFIFSFLLVSCNNKKDNDKNIKNTTAVENSSEKKSIFEESALKEKDYSNILSEIEYINDKSYKLKIRIEQKDDIIFTTENQNVYADISISSNNFGDGHIIYEKKIDDSLYKIPLNNNKIPNITEILIDENSPLLSKEEHEEILKKSDALTVSVQIRDPQGYILEVSNTIL